MADWNPVVVLPNIDLCEPIEGGLAVLTPTDDCRLQQLMEKQPTLRTFLDNFTDTFGRKISPSVMIVSPNAPEKILRSDVIASFRDAVALSVIPFGRALEVVFPYSRRVLWADSFSIYPWMISKNFDAVIGRTPAIMGYEDIASFRGQNSPEVFQMKIAANAIDTPLLAVLLDRWRAHYTSGKPSWRNEVLFRSLNMAYRASELPAGADATFYDEGRSISLWISAFEVLSHPGEMGDAGLSSVYKLLECTPWLFSASKREEHLTYKGRKSARTSKCNACWLYGELYHARNDFLHGNPVKMDRLVIQKSGRNLFDFVGPLYRMALAAFLELEWKRPTPSPDNVEELAKYIDEHLRFTQPQKIVEQALLAAHMKKQ